MVLVLCNQKFFGGGVGEWGEIKLINLPTKTTIAAFAVTTYVSRNNDASPKTRVTMPRITKEAQYDIPIFMSIPLEERKALVCCFTAGTEEVSAATAAAAASVASFEVFLNEDGVWGLMASVSSYDDDDSPPPISDRLLPENDLCSMDPSNG